MVFAELLGESSYEWTGYGPIVYPFLPGFFRIDQELWKVVGWRPCLWAAEGLALLVTQDQIPGVHWLLGRTVVSVPTAGSPESVAGWRLQRECAYDLELWGDHVDLPSCWES